MRNVPRWSQVAILTKWLFIRSVLGQACGPISVNTTQDAEAARNCREVNGDIYISPTTSANIDLSGVETVHGSVRYDGIPDDISVNISSSTLTRVDGHVSVSWTAAVQNVSFPKLQTVGGDFSLYSLDNLTYVDVTDLHSVGVSFELFAPRLSTLKHTELRYVGGYGQLEGISIRASDLESVDSLFNNPIKVNRAVVIESPRLKRVVVGLNETNELFISGSEREGHLEVVLGGQSATSMKVGTMSMYGGIAGMQRDPRLQTLTVDTFFSSFNNYTHLDLPFDQLQKLFIEREQNLARISNPPQAMQWTNFSFVSWDNPNLNLSSESVVDEAGETVRSWYWPQKDMFDIDIVYTNVSNSFFDSFLEYQTATADTTSHPRVLYRFSVGPTKNHEFDCEPFEKLADKGILNDYICYGKSAAQSWRRLPAATGWAALLIAAATCFIIS